MNKKEDLKIRASLPSTITLNKKVIIAIAIIILVILLLVLINAFSVHEKQVKPRDLLNTDNDIYQAVNKNVTQLPSYDDFSQINKLLEQQPQTSEAKLIAMRKQLIAFQQSQNELKQELENLKMQRQNLATTPTIQQVESPENQQADSSSLFFSGGAPNFSAEKTKQSAHSLEAVSGTNGSTTSKDNQNKSSSYATQNNQTGKLDFLGKNKHVLNLQVMQMPRSPYELLQGTFIPAVLITATNSDVPGAVKAQVRQNIYDTVTGNYLLIPQGSYLIGEYNSQISYGQTRVQMIFTRLIRPDGSSIKLSNPQAMEDSGVSGLIGKVDNHWGRVIASALLVSAFSIPAVVINNRSYPYYPQPNNVAADSLMNGVTQVGTQIASRGLQVQPTIKLPSGKLLTIMVQRDMIIPPYKGINND